MTYKIIWSKQATKNLNDIVEYLVADNLVVAKEVLLGIAGLGDDLYFFPERGRGVEEIKVHGEYQYKILLYHRWKVIYRIDNRNKQVIISLVVDCNRDLNSVLENNFTDNLINEQPTKY